MNLNKSVIIGILVGMTIQCVADRVSEDLLDATDAHADPVSDCAEYHHEWNYDIDHQTCVAYKDIICSCDNLEHCPISHRLCWLEHIPGISGDPTPMLFVTTLFDQNGKAVRVPWDFYRILNDDLVLFVVTITSTCSIPLTSSVKYCR